MKFLRYSFLVLSLLIVASVGAQTRDITLTVKVTSVGDDNLNGQIVNLIQSDFDLTYSNLKLDETGTASIKVYSGPHHLEIKRNGFNDVAMDFDVPPTPKEQTVNVALTEKTRTPFALDASLSHDAFTGMNDVNITWNTEKPVFFDDFESYTPFSINFGEWTGIDVDLEAAAALVGSYPNRGVQQYAQIINPLTVTPTWWYEYEVLRPYSGQQYVGFTRTSSGNANDDWLISPVILPGTDNILSFMAKAADIYTERFMVYVTTVTDNPSTEDFIRIDRDNYESADYKGWKEYTYDLSNYAGKQIRFAIRYISDASRYGAFMLMLDDVYVGPVRRNNGASQGMAQRISKRSADNRFEKFEIYLDGEKVATTEEYSYTLKNVAAGEHTIGIKAIYLQAQSEMVETRIDIDNSIYSNVTFKVTADSKASVDSQKISLVGLENAQEYTLPIINGESNIPSLPFGKYEVYISESTFTAYSHQLEVNSGTTTLDIELTDNIIDPYNLTVTTDKNSVTLQWNQRLGFSDSFEDYDDFATGQFGDWLTYDVDGKPVYPVALGSMDNIISFPGSGDASNPTPVGPMVFNPYKTVPPMMPDDPAIAAPTGDKSIIFFSAQRDQSDKWLISPEIEIFNNYELTFKAKAYTRMYLESLEIYYAEEGDHPENFTILAEIPELYSSSWSIYTVDLSQFAGKTIRLAIRYISYDAFLSQVDDFTVGPKEGETEFVDYGNIINFEIYLDGSKIDNTENSFYTFNDLSEGDHTLGVKAIYKNASSKLVEYTLNVSGVENINVNIPAGTPKYFDLQGRPLKSAPESGMYLMVLDGKCSKRIK